MPRRKALLHAEDDVPLSLVERAGLEVEGIDEGATAPAGDRLALRGAEERAAEAAPAARLVDPEGVDTEPLPPVSP